MKYTGLFIFFVSLVACGNVGGVDIKYSDTKHASQYGYPEIAQQLGKVDTDCVLDASQWEPVFVNNNITTGRRVTNTLQGMKDNGQIIYFQDKRVIAVSAKYCNK